MDKYSLRRMRDSDLELVFKWRNSNRIRKVMFSTAEIKWETHTAWYQNLLESKMINSVKILMYKSKPIGFVNLSSIDTMGYCSWGFYIGDDDAPKGSGQIMGYLAIEHAFDKLSVNGVIGDVFEVNEPSRKLHNRLFFKEIISEEKSVVVDGISHKVIRFELSKARWHEHKKHIEVKL